MSIPPLADVRIDLPAPPGVDVFNGSICQHRGRTLLAYRHGYIPAEVRLVELGANWQPVGPPRRLALPWPQCEDPRLFLHAGELHVAFTALATPSGSADVAVARLAGDDFRVEEARVLRFQGAQPSEKNWGCYSHGGRLYCVYRINRPHPFPAGPRLHRVLRVEGGRAVEAYAEPSGMAAAVLHLGDLRGGAAPALHGGEYFSFVHGYGNEHPPGRPDLVRYVYTLGLYCFSSSPPFRPTRYCPTPLMLPPDAPGSRANVSCVYPCGAIHRDGLWHVSYGWQDLAVRVVSWKAEDIESALIDVDG
jgi:predicted GH43/DUF377 family glycosyl hydrolase